MHVLVCDDDRATRITAKKLLTQEFGCSVTEAGDGVEALGLIAREHFGLVILDIEMPEMNGIEVLELIRQSPDSATLPVVMLTRERNEEVIRKLLKLGISDYVLKPLRMANLSDKLKKLLTTLPDTAGPIMDSSQIQLSPDSPALIVDGNLDYRFFFQTQTEKYGVVRQADTGAAAIVQFRQAPVSLVFIGSELGIVGAEALVKKLKGIRPQGPLRLVGLVDAKSTAPTDLFTDVMPRSFLPAVFKRAMAQFVFIPGPLSALTAVVPRITDIVTSATTQVFGIMFDAEVVPASVDAEVQAAASSTLQIDLDDRFSMTLGVHLTTAAATEVAAKMFGMEPGDVVDEDRESVAGELGNLITGRVHATLRERQLNSVCSLPTLHKAAPVAFPAPGSGFLRRFSLPGGSDLVLSLLVRDLAAEQLKSAAATPTPATAPAEATDSSAQVA